MLKFLEGRKTYMAGWALVFLALGNLLQNWVDGQPLELEKSMEQLVLGFGIIGGRSALGKVASDNKPIEPPRRAA